MALKLRKRKIDPKEVQLLFDLHKLLNHGGKHWIKGIFYKRVKNVGMCYCLSGGVNKIAPSIRMNNRLRDLLERAIQAKTRYFGIVAFNDATATTWPEVEGVIRESIKIGRHEA